jgi:hypothetical protein
VWQCALFNLFNPLKHNNCFCTYHLLQPFQTQVIFLFFFLFHFPLLHNPIFLYLYSFFLLCFFLQFSSIFIEFVSFVLSFPLLHFILLLLLYYLTFNLLVLQLFPLLLPFLRYHLVISSFSCSVALPAQLNIQSQTEILHFTHRVHLSVSYVPRIKSDCFLKQQ